METTFAPKVMDLHNTSKNGLPDAAAILEAGPASVALIDIEDYKLLYISKQFEYILGYTKEDVRSADFSFYDLLDPEDTERFKLQVKLSKRESSFNHKYSGYKLRTKAEGDKQFYIYVSSMPGTSVFHMLVMPDFTTSGFPFNSADTRDLFLRQLETEKYGSFEWMIESGTVFWTNSLYEIYEVEKGKHIDRAYVSTFTHPDDARRAATAVQRAIEENARIDMEMKIVTGRGNVKVVRVLANVITDENGTALKLAGSIKDITAQRKIEQDLKKKVEELHRSNKELEEFAYVASHDLQEPLRKISTFSDRLAEKYSELLTGEGAMYLDRMMVSAENMRMLIHNLLEFSRVTRHNEPFSTVGLDFVLRQVKNDLELVIEETGTKIEAGKVPEVDGSLSQLAQLFTNIIGNAIKFRKENGSPLIRVTAEKANADELVTHDLPANTAYHKISIADNGIGFEPEYAEKIFQIFQRLHGKSEYPGSGIGLAICKRIADNHKGAIYAESKEGEGAIFVILLPAQQ